jgi:hemerythrin-like domain-containing protein
MSMRQFLMVGLQFCSSLEMHHNIEETYIFPILAKKMPAFQKELELLTQHKAIHAGLDGFQDYLTQCKTGERELRLDEMKERMDTFGKVLWQHMDDEVKELGAENMRKYWTPEEMKEIPM